jgi:sigma-B regulation protein RsbU (phosphoserine phosphatase)
MVAMTYRQEGTPTVVDTVNGISERSKFRHEVRTLLNHAVGYGELLAVSAEAITDITFTSAIMEIREAVLKLRQPALDFMTVVSEGKPHNDELKQEVYAGLYDLVCLIQAVRRRIPQDVHAGALEDVSRVHEAVNKLADLFEEIESRGNFSGEMTTGLPFVFSGIAKRSGRILVVDDDQFSRELLARHLERQGHLVCQAKSGQIAFEILAEAAFDILILDIMMPGMNGYQFLEAIRTNSYLKDTAIIVVSALDDPASIARCLELGAEDYLPRDFDPSIMKARIDSLLEKQEYKQRNDLAMKHLIEAQNQMATELREAAEYVKSLLPKPLAWHGIVADWDFIPSLSLGGDCFFYHPIDDTRLAMYILDVSGHGIQAALLSATIMNMLRSLALGGLDYGSPSAVLARLNASFQVEEQNNMFFTIWYGVYDTSSRSLRWAGAGCPPAVMIGPANTIVELSGDGPVIGVDETASFGDFAMSVLPGSHLYLFSDGLFEVHAKDASMLAWDQFIALLAAHNQECASAPSCLSPINRMVDAIRNVCGRDIFDDDISIVEFAFND